LRWLAEDAASTCKTIDGSMVFVDISGFTKMSERLARHGKVGAEEVTDVLGAVFAKLLAVAYGEDGSQLKFRGEPVLLWVLGVSGGFKSAPSPFSLAADSHRELRSPAPAASHTVTMESTATAGEIL